MGAAGSAVLNFGVFPGTDVASVTVTGQAGIVAGSLVDAQIRIASTAEHSEDEHAMFRGSGAVEVGVKRSSIVPGTSLTIYGACADKSKMWGNINLDWEWV